MKSMFLMSLANLKKKKAQSILIALTIMVSALIFSTSVGMLTSMNKPMEKMFKELNASHALISFEPGKYDEKEIKAWWQNQEEVESIQLLKGNFSMQEVFLGDRNLEDYVVVTERPMGEITQDKLLIYKGEEKLNPEPGEIWIASSFAFSDNLKIGDVISIPSKDGYEDKKISAIVVDPQYSNHSMNPTRMWVAPGELNDNNLVILGIRYKDPAVDSSLWKEFQENLGHPFNGTKLDFDTINYAFLFLYRIIGVLLLIFSVIIIVVATLTISLTINGAILSDYKVIGILKSQGFTKRNIVGTYASQYLMLSLVSIPLGIFLSSYTIKLILNDLIKSLGGLSTEMSMTVPFTITFIFILLTIALTAFIASFKGGRIKPANSIRFGAPPAKYSSKTNIELTKLKKLSLSASLGIKDMLSNKRQSIFLLAATAITAFVFVFGVNTYNSVKDTRDNGPYWGISAAEIVISGELPEEQITQLNNMLNEDDRIASVVTSFMTDDSAMPAIGDKAPQNVMGNIYDGDMDSIGLINLFGRNPANKNEVSLSYNISKEYNKDIGDYVDIYLDGNKHTLLVTGIYQSMSNGGRGFRMRQSEIVTNRFSDSINYLVKLNDGVDIDKVIEDYNNNYEDGIFVKSNIEAIKKQNEVVVSSIAVVVMILYLIFVGVSSIIIFNSTLMNVYEHKKNYGILKALGMTPGQIRMSITNNVLATAILGLIIGIPAGVYLSPKLLGAMFESLGMMEFPFNIDITGTLLIIPILLIINGLSAWIPSGQILKINPRNLIVE